MNGIIRALQRALLVALLAIVSAPSALADDVEAFPDRYRAASRGCIHAGELLSNLAIDRRQGMPESAAALNFYERYRNYDRAGSHIPSAITRQNAGVLTKFVYAFPQLPDGVFALIGTYNCEIQRRLPAGNPNAGDVLPLLGVNAHDCMQREGAKIKPQKPDAAGLWYDNDQVDACEGRAAKAILRELLKPQ